MFVLAVAHHDGMVRRESKEMTELAKFYALGASEKELKGVACAVPLVNAHQHAQLFCDPRVPIKTSDEFSMRDSSVAVFVKRAEDGGKV